MKIKKELLWLINEEAKYATKQYGPFKSPHKAYGVLKEEFEEWWDSIKNDEQSDYELLQVVAVGFRYLVERVKENYALLGDISDEQVERWESNE